MRSIFECARLVADIKKGARKPLEIKGFRAFYILMKMTLQHFCNTQCEIYKKEWLQVAIKFI